MNIPTDTLGSRVDTLLIHKAETTRKVFNDRKSLLQEVVDKITIEDLVDTIISTKERNTLQVFPDTLSAHTMVLPTGDLLIINGFDVLQASGLFPFRISVGGSIKLLQRSPLLTLPYLSGGLSLITTGMILIFVKKMNTYLFLKFIK